MRAIEIQWAGRRSIAVLLGTLLGLACCEAVVRWTRLDPLSRTGFARQADGWYQDCVRLSSELGYELAPNTCGTNSYGLLDRERPLQRSPGELRIAALGDSISADRLYTDFLESLLSGRLDRPVDVLNFGVPGYSTRNELEVLRHKALATEPDIVLLQFCLNDYFITPVFVRTRGRVVVIDAWSGELSGHSWVLFQRSALFRLVYARMLQSSDWPIPFQERSRALRESLETIRRLAREHDAILLLVVFPYLVPLEEYPKHARLAYDHILRASRELDIPTLDLTKRFAASDIRSLARAREEATYRALDRVSSAYGYPTGLADWMWSLEKAKLQLTESGQAGEDDITHPNFFGHFLAADEIAKHIDAHHGRKLRARPPGQPPARGTTRAPGDRIDATTHDDVGDTGLESQGEPSR